ncbi:hypothetical protein SERLA73DRAFT_175836 [Serpula lacrymans var. lacrymans S7.3]|uniref:Uncharacterized protein n=1 Tax=Serpula lacrymans var. lacrymans (strain S7.3) TaxID=936435 RepID=F8PJF0_SERL3|nr:hypothetical protein SERLA73DRAFT_175836 [Serpula lacrymans var. lacrymans S7.3]
MYVPFITPKLQTLARRKGGGGGGRGGGGSSSSGGESGGTSSGSGSKGSSGGSTGGTAGRTSSVPLSGSSASGKSSATSYGAGGGKSITIPSGQLFSGRTAGGGTRQQVVGTRTYGSGYPGISGRGVTGRGFPFWFWPVIWGGAGAGSGAYLVDREYGDSTNTSRVGGPMVEATFVSNSTNTTFHLLSDNSTVSSLLTSIDSNCSSSLSSSSSTSPVPFNQSASGVPKPEQAVQYYRASSVVLTLDGYNNSATLSNDTSAPDSPLPSGIDTTLLDCLNQTILQAAPLVDGAGMRWSAPSSAGLVGLVWVMWCLSSLI